jgi:integrase
MKRYYDGVELVANLYPSERKIAQKWRYKNPKSKKWVHLKELMTVAEANQLATELNDMVADGFYERHATPSERLSTYVKQYQAYRERLDPSLIDLPSWYNRKTVMNKFARENFKNIKSIDMDALRTWWDDQSYHQQKLRRAEFLKLFNWLMGKHLVPKLNFNPFTNSDDVPRLLSKSKPQKKRKPCSQSTFDMVYKNAGLAEYECLQIAMNISRYTTLREGDICSLRWDDIKNGCLRVVVMKSLGQKGESRATRLSWSLKDHPELKRYIDRARELSLINKRCPFVISHTPKRRAWNEDKEHLCQVTGDRLSRMFNDCRGESATTFHEVRGLSATLLKNAGNTNKQIKEIMAHESINTTLDYMNPDDLPFETVTIHI